MQLYAIGRTRRGGDITAEIAFKAHANHRDGRLGLQGFAGINIGKLIQRWRNIIDRHRRFIDATSLLQLRGRNDEIGIDPALRTGGFMVIGIRRVADVGPVRPVRNKRSLAAQVGVTVVELLPEFRFGAVVKTAGRVGTVVGGKDDNGVLITPGLLQCFHYPADLIVHIGDHRRIHLHGFGRIFPLFRRHGLPLFFQCQMRHWRAVGNNPQRLQAVDTLLVYLLITRIIFAVKFGDPVVRSL